MDNIYFTVMVSVVKRSVNKLFDCCKHRAWKFLSIEFCCLFHFADVYRLQKMFNHLVYNTYHIVDDIISCKWLINILFAVCKLSIRNLVEIVCKLNDVAEIVYKMIDDVNKLLQRYILVEIAWCDLSFAKELFECLLTMIRIFYEYD